MAGPVAHMVCALTLLNNNALNVEDEQAFLIGTSFPDIRYLNVIKREQTHRQNITWQDVHNESDPFKAGMLLHSLVDRVREEYMVKHHVYDLIPKFPFYSQCLKLYEDMLVYDSVDDWQFLSNYFKTILAEEKKFGIKKDDIAKWHRMIQAYLEQKPTPHGIAYRMKRIMFANRYGTVGYYIPNYPVTKYLETMIGSMAQNKKLQHIITNFYQNIVYFLVNS